MSFDTISSPGSGSIAAGTPILLRSGTVDVAAGQTLTMNARVADGTAATALVKSGSGKLVLAGVNTYTGPTTVRQGTLVVSPAASLASGTVAIDGGTLRFNALSPLSSTVEFTSGTVGGTNLLGSLDGLTIGTGQAVSPGNSPGFAETGSQTWAGGGTYVWEMNDAAGFAGDDPGWDLLWGYNTLTITSGSASPFIIAVTSLTTANLSGTAANFDPAVAAAWLIADFANSVVDFDATKFQIDTSGFLNSFSGLFGIALGGTGSLDGDDSQLYVTYIPVPEPQALVLGGLGLLGLLWRRRARARPAGPRAECRAHTSRCRHPSPR